MNNYKRITRLTEQEAIADSYANELGLQPEMEDSIELSQEKLELPAAGESSAEPNPMTMTVADFMIKCKELDPLVCMGIEAFIDKNREALGGTHVDGVTQDMETDHDDLSFSAQIEPQNDELSFPA